MRGPDHACRYCGSCSRVGTSDANVFEQAVCKCMLTSAFFQVLPRWESLCVVVVLLQFGPDFFRVSVLDGVPSSRLRRLGRECASRAAKRRLSAVASRATGLQLTATWCTPLYLLWDALQPTTTTGRAATQERLFAPEAPPDEPLSCAANDAGWQSSIAPKPAAPSASAARPVVIQPPSPSTAAVPTRPVNLTSAACPAAWTGDGVCQLTCAAAPTGTEVTAVPHRRNVTSRSGLATWHRCAAHEKPSARVGAAEPGCTMWPIRAAATVPH